MRVTRREVVEAVSYVLIEKHGFSVNKSIQVGHETADRLGIGMPSDELRESIATRIMRRYESGGRPMPGE